MWLSISFSLFLIGIILLANSGSDLIMRMIQFPMADKVGHFCLFGFLAFLVNKALGCRTTTLFGNLVLVGSLCVISLVALEELSQIFIITRQFDITDFMYDGVGIYLGGFIAVLTENLRMGERVFFRLIRKTSF